MKAWPGYVLFFVLVLLSGCGQFLFYPHSKLIRTPSDLGLEYRDVYFTAQDGSVLHGWFLPATSQPARGSVLFLHGNAENISTHIGSVYWLPDRGFNLFLFDYRGYGLSQGRPSLQGVHEDAEQALSVLLAQSEVKGLPVALFGQSLGGAIAIYTTAYAARRGAIKALIVESSFSSYRKVAREALGSFWLTWPLQWPLSLTISDRYHPGRAIEKIDRIPVLLIHGENDTIVSARHNERLYQLANEPKMRWLVPGGGHINAFNSQEYRDRLVEYLEATLNSSNEGFSGRRN